MKTISIRVRRDFDHRIRILAAQLDMNRSAFVRMAVREKVAQMESETGTHQAEGAQTKSEIASQTGADARLSEHV